MEPRLNFRDLESNLIIFSRTLQHSCEHGPNGAPFTRNAHPRMKEAAMTVLRGRWHVTWQWQADRQLNDTVGVTLFVRTRPEVRKISSRKLMRVMTLAEGVRVVIKWAVDVCLCWLWTLGGSHSHGYWLANCDSNTLCMWWNLQKECRKWYS